MNDELENAIRRGLNNANEFFRTLRFGPTCTINGNSAAEQENLDLKASAGQIAAAIRIAVRAVQEEQDTKPYDFVCNVCGKVTLGLGYAVEGTVMDGGNCITRCRYCEGSERKS